MRNSEAVQTVAMTALVSSTADVRTSVYDVLKFLNNVSVLLTAMDAKFESVQTLLMTALVLSNTDVRASFYQSLKLLYMFPVLLTALDAKFGICANNLDDRCSVIENGRNRVVL